MTVVTSAELIAQCRDHTERANQALERHAAWCDLSRAIKRLLLAYEGNKLHPVIKGWYDAIVTEKAARTPHLQALYTDEREAASRKLAIFNDMELK